QPRRDEPVRGRGGEGHVPHVPQHARLPARGGAAEAEPEEGREEEPDRPGARGHAAASRPPAASRRPPQEEARPLGRGGAPEEEVVRAVDVIQRKRDGLELSAAEIDFLVRGFAEARIPDYQASAFAMAVYFRGMTPAETIALTESMMGTGEVLDLHDLPGPK